MEATLNNNSICIPIGAKFRILFDNSSQEPNKREVVDIVDDGSNKFLALFERDNVDFKIQINNLEEKARGFMLGVETLAKKKRFYIAPDRSCELRTLETGGGKFHFVSQESTAGRQLVDLAAKELKTSHSDASVQICKIKLLFEAEIVPKQQVVPCVVKEATSNPIGMQNRPERLCKPTPRSSVGEPQSLPIGRGRSARGRAAVPRGHYDAVDGANPGAAVAIPRPRPIGQGLVPCSAPSVGHGTPCNSDSYKRGAICFGDKSDQIFTPHYGFIADKTIQIKPVVIEFQIKTNLKLK